MSATLSAPEAPLLPAAFAELEPFVGWALPTEEERYRRRIGSSMADIQAFYDAILPVAAEARDYLDKFELTAMPAEAQRLLWMLFSLINIGYAVEIFGEPQVPDTGSAYMYRIGEPPSFPV